MRLNLLRNVAALLLVPILAACTGKQEAAKPQPAIAKVSDPTPPAPPNSVEVPADLKNMPAFLLLAIGGIADEGEKEGIAVQENLRIFRTDAAVQAITSFYTSEMKARGWTNHNQTAQSAKVGLTMQEYRRPGQALYLIVSEPEDPQSSDATKSKRHVALLPATVKKTK